MLELKNIEKEDYSILLKIIKENIDSWIEDVEEYNNFDNVFLDCF